MNYKAYDSIPDGPLGDTGNELGSDDVIVLQHV
jgi:hypothetical protein